VSRHGRAYTSLIAALSCALLACTSGSAIKPLAGGAPPPDRDAGPAKGEAGLGAALFGGSGRAASAGAGAGGSATQIAVPDAAVPLDDDAGDDDAGPAAPPACADCCPDRQPRTVPGVNTQLLLPFRPSALDVAVCPSGDAFVTLDGPDEIWRVPVTGAPALYASVSGVQPAGIACDDRGRLYVATLALRTGSSYERQGLLLIDAPGATPVLLPKPGGVDLITPNSVAFVRGEGVFFTDSAAGLVVRTRELASGKFTSDVVAEDQYWIDGIAFDPRLSKLYISNSLTLQVSSLILSEDGTLSAPKLEWSVDRGAWIEGLAVDETGSVYVASSQTGQVLRLPGQAVVTRLNSPSGLAFRGGALLVTDYLATQLSLDGGLYQVALGLCGADLFGP
jgi:sugar lactone lactonase YvrE